MKTANSKQRMVTYRRSAGSPIPEVVKANVKELLTKPEWKIDTSDIPERPADAWKHAVRGRFYRPMKQAASLRLDADVLAWLKKDGAGYQTRVEGKQNAAGTDDEGFGGAVGWRL